MSKTAWRNKTALLIADKDFAGIPAGENLIPFLWTIRNGYTASRWQESSADNKELWDQIPLAEGFMLPFDLGGNLQKYPSLFQFP